jgi:putative endonuclease
MSSPGAFLENIALRWLKARGLRVVANNYVCSSGKIDVIMLDGKTLCFIDVKYPGHPDFRGPDSDPPVSDQQKMIQIAASFVSHQRKFLNYSQRFDTLIVKPGVDEPYEMEWIKDVVGIDIYQIR